MTVPVCAYCFKKFTRFKENYFSLILYWIFSFKIDSINLVPDPGSVSKLGQNPGSGSEFNVFGSPTLGENSGKNLPVVSFKA